MTDISKIKTNGGWAMAREKYSLSTVELLKDLLPYQRKIIQLPEYYTLRGSRFDADNGILARLESYYTEAEFLACPGLRIDHALIDAAQSDYWYAFEKTYGYDEDECEVEDDE